MKVLAMSKPAFDKLLFEKGVTPANVEQQDKLVFISLNNNLECSTPGEKPFFPSDKRNVKVMRFADTDKDSYVPLIDGSNRKVLAKAFTPRQASELYGFIKDNVIVGKTEAVLIHCTMGIARSGAVASFIHDFISGRWEVFKRDNPQIQPNAHVYRLLQEEWFKDSKGLLTKDETDFQVEVQNPTSPEKLAQMYNLEHPDQHTSVHYMTAQQIKEKYGKEL